MITYNFIKYLIIYIQYRRILDRIYKEENILYNLSETYHANFKKDWIGRVYAIINPLVNIDPSDYIFDSTEKGYDIQSFVDKWIIERLTIASDFIMNKTLFELVTYHLEKIDDNYNFLFTLDPIAWYDLKIWLKRFLWLIGSLMVVAIIACIIYATIF